MFKRILDQRGSSPIVLPIKRASRLGTSKSIHPIGFVDFTVCDHILDLFRVTYILCGICPALEDHQVSKFADFDGTKVTV
jgi:hypothetical protein